MSYDSIALRAASRHVRDFSDENLMALHYEAIDCWDCEAFLQLGIDAFDWIITADQHLRRLIYVGQVEVDFDSCEEQLLSACKQWLVKSSEAIEWLQKHETSGNRVKNAERFRTCYEEMIAIVKFYSTEENAVEKLPPAIEQLAEQARGELANGETAEFI